MKILTNHPGQKASPTWDAVTTYCPPQDNSGWSSFKLALELYRQRLSYDCIVLGAGMSDVWFALLQSLMSGRMVPCIMIDCYWTAHPNRLKQLITRWILGLCEKSVDRFVVWARRDIKAFAEAFGLPEGKFIFIPYHTTIDAYPVAAWQGGYIFSGGNFGRDYETLIAAVKGLPVKVLIASTNPQVCSNISIPDNVEIRGFGHEEYIHKMAGCLMNVVCLQKGILRSAGQQTFLNSMWFGKPTIVTDTEGAADYITHGEDGLLVPPHNPGALREALEFLLTQPGAMTEMGRKAARKVKGHTTEEHFKKIVSVARTVIESRQARRVR